MQKFRADLHLHTVCSDGAYTPSEIARRCKEAGLFAFSITDHDNMDGTEEGEKAARVYGLGYVRGWEISAYNGACKVHVLGYGCEKNEAYDEFLRQRFRGALVRIGNVLKKANDYFGLNVTMDEVESYHLRKTTPVHTMHVVTAFACRLSRKKGELYNEAFAFGCPAFSEECRPTPEDAIDVIHKTGGVAVLAHPGRIRDLTLEEYNEFRSTQDVARRGELLHLSDERRKVLMDSLVRAGLDGIESCYTTHTTEETEYFLHFAAENHLLVTGGSDFHAEGARNVLGLPEFFVDERLAEALKLRH